MCYVVAPETLCHNPGCSVLESLKSVNLRLRSTGQHAVAIIQSRHHQGQHQRNRSITGQVFTNVPNVPDVEEADFLNVVDMFNHRQITVKHDSEISD